MIILRQRAYAESQEGMSTGKKVALGTIGTLGTAGLAFAGAKHGAFGGKAMIKANKAWGNLGTTLANKGFNPGKNMIASAAKGEGQGKAKILADRLRQNNVSEDIIKERASKLAQSGQNRALNRYEARLTTPSV